jgi:hypothetical protein
LKGTGILSLSFLLLSSHPCHSSRINVLPHSLVTPHTILVDTNDGNEERVDIGGESISSGAQLQQLANLPFLALGSDLKIESEQSDSWLKQSNISINCEHRSPTMMYVPIDRRRDCQPLAWAVTQNYLAAARSRSVDRSIVLNPYLGSTIERVKLSDLSKQNPNLFKGKFLVVGFVKDRSSPAMIHAIAIEQIVRLIDNSQPFLAVDAKSADFFTCEQDRKEVFVTIVKNRNSGNIKELIRWESKSIANPRSKC